MNIWRILAGGLAAGFTSNILGLAFVALVLRDQMREALSRFDVQLGAGAFFLHCGLRFSYGLLAVWLYAGLRPRLGPGIGTALTTAFVIWWAMVPLLLLYIHDFRIYPPWAVIVLGGWSLIEMCLVCLVGAWIYRELPTP